MSTPEINKEDENTQKGRDYGYPILLGVAVLVALLIKVFVAELYLIPSDSMSPTLHGDPRSGDRVLVNKVAYTFGEPEPGDIVVFEAPPEWEEIYGDSNVIKRVIATEGQTVGLDDRGNITIDGEPLNEPYLGIDYAFEKDVLDCYTTPKSQRCFPDFDVPEGHVWIMGDNRKRSMDSTWGCRGSGDMSMCLGALPVESIIGRAERVVFPLSHGKSL